MLSSTTSIPGWQIFATSSAALITKLISGSLVLRSGVGTQMLIVIHLAQVIIGGGGAQMPGLDQRSKRFGWNVGDVTHARVQLIDFVVQHVQPDDVITHPRELNRQRQPDIPHTNDADLGGAIMDPIQKLLPVVDHDSSQSEIQYERSGSEVPKSVRDYSPLPWRRK